MIKVFFLIIVKFYQISISPYIGKYCIYIPTCSEYMVILLKKKYNVFKVFFLITKRILSCHPFGKSEY
ncbi:membrane protein insertion efficiency factor YidD [Blattabacterium cuenoti]|uniref:membrane protein insertion efficiency factor YidD n=1 Tax=Blattabacterium cuenoti TaxID=1653831 RepID=UPI00163C7CA8|nr:membrane protein insertion efficiency factor YidD [Blattabacterium cuenoti]